MNQRATYPKHFKCPKCGYKRAIVEGKPCRCCQQSEHDAEHRLTDREKRVLSVFNNASLDCLELMLQAAKLAELEWLRRFLSTFDCLTPEMIDGTMRELYAKNGVPEAVSTDRPPPSESRT